MKFCSENPLASVGGNTSSDTNEIILVFEQPIPAGNTITVALETQQNPSYGNVYQFGITAFPNSELIPPLEIGTARLHFFGSNY